MRRQFGGIPVVLATPINQIIDSIAQAPDDPQSILVVPELQAPVLSLLRDEIESEIEYCALIADQMGRSDIGNQIRAMRFENLKTLRIIH